MDSLYFNARVFTGEGPDKFADAFRIKNGRFAWVGRLEGAPEPGAVDLGGAAVVPGFIEAHTHPLLVAQTIHAVPCTIPAVHSIAEILEALRKHPNFGRGPNDWIMGWGHDESKLAEHRTPTRHDLDRVSTTQPVYLLRSDVHSGVCNTRALEIAGITRDTPDPQGGKIGHDPDGEPNGVFTELAANRLIQRAIERPDFENAVRAMAECGPHYRERGYAAITEMMAKTGGETDTLRVFRAAASRGLYPQAGLYRIWTGGDDPRGMPDLTEDEKTGRVRVEGIKLFADGSISGQTAWVNEPYKGSSSHGMCTLELPVLAAAVDYARRNGIQVSIHVMGDLSIQRIVDFFEGQTGWLTSVPSVRLEHVSLITKRQLEQIRRQAVNYGLTTQIIFAFAEYEGYEQALVPEVFARMYPVRSLVESGVPFALSSDAPATTWMDPENVFVSVKAAVLRRTYNGVSINPQQAVSVGEALYRYTGGASKLLAFETPVGMIAPGFEANFSVLSDDPFAIAPEALDSVRIASFYHAGRLVYTEG